MDAKSIVNLGLGKIAASRVSSISPPKSPIERHVAEGYPQWRDSELQKRTWVFSLWYQPLTAVSTDNDIANEGRKYQFALPNDLLKPIRDRHTEWEIRGPFLFSSQSTVILPYVRRVSEALFPALFVDVLAARVAMESVEYATQSNTKADAVEAKHYVPAITEAGKANAFVVGPQDQRLDDENSEWITARFGAC